MLIDHVRSQENGQLEEEGTNYEVQNIIEHPCCVKFIYNS